MLGILTIRHNTVYKAWNGLPPANNHCQAPSVDPAKAMWDVLFQFLFPCCLAILECANVLNSTLERPFITTIPSCWAGSDC